jgi:hypothetical protein
VTEEKGNLVINFAHLIGPRRLTDVPPLVGYPSTKWLLCIRFAGIDRVWSNDTLGHVISLTEMAEWFRLMHMSVESYRRSDNPVYQSQQHDQMQDVRWELKHIVEY